MTAATTVLAMLSKPILAGKSDICPPIKADEPLMCLRLGLPRLVVASVYESCRELEGEAELLRPLGGVTCSEPY